MENITILANGITTIANKLEPFFFMKPVQDAIVHNLPIGEQIGSVTSILLFVLDIVLLIGLVSGVIVAVTGVIKIAIWKMKINKETTDAKQTEKDIEKCKKHTISGALTLGIAFLLLPSIASFVAWIISSV